MITTKARSLSAIVRRVKEPSPPTYHALITDAAVPYGLDAAGEIAVCAVGVVRLQSLDLNVEFAQLDDDEADLVSVDLDLLWLIQFRPFKVS